MSNRIAWIAVAVVVLVVGVLVFRSTRPGSVEMPGRVPPAAQRPGPGPEPQAQKPSTDETKPPTLAERAQLSGVHRAKRALKERGYYDGPIDGNYTPELAEAIKRFQKDAGMKVDGYLNSSTYAALGLNPPISRRR